MRTRIAPLVVAAVFAVILHLSCGDATVAPTDLSRTPTPVPAATLLPTPTPVPTATALPTPTPIPTATPIPGREDLYRYVNTPEHMAFTEWWWREGETFRELVVDFTIHNDPDQFSPSHGLYFIVANGLIGHTSFYFGLQTKPRNPADPFWEGKAAIFSRWDERDLAWTRAVPGGWTESSGHEGDFIGVRCSYDWGAGDYRMRLAPTERDPDGEWYGLSITDRQTGETTELGALKFPLVDGTTAFFRWSYTTLEIYGGYSIRPIQIPEWEVTVEPPLGDGTRPYWTKYGYSYFHGQILNTNIDYSETDGSILLRVGGTTERVTPGAADLIVLPPFE